MNETSSALKAWESFYVIVGSSAGALTGLQFVVMTLVGEAARGGQRNESISAFGSPNVVHFCAALLMSAILSAPWTNLGAPGVAMAICGVGGVIYSIVVIARAVRVRDYKPVLEDWVWHNVLPFLAYGSLVYSGLELRHEHPDTLYLIGGASLLLMFIGIHNAWDTIMYIIVVGLKPREPEGRHRGSRQGRS